MTDASTSAETIVLGGEIKSAQISQSRAQAEKSLLALSSATRTVDLQELETFNSQVLSLCLCLLRLAEKNGFELRFCNTPSKLFDMARVGGLEFIFEAESS